MWGTGVSLLNAVYNYSHICPSHDTGLVELKPEPIASSNLSPKHVWSECDLKKIHISPIVLPKFGVKMVQLGSAK